MKGQIEWELLGVLGVWIRPISAAGDSNWVTAFFLSLQVPWAAFSCGARSICWHAAVGPVPLLSSPVSVLCLISDASAPLSAWAAGSLMLSTANYGCNAKELILRSALHSSIHNHSRLFRTGKRGGLLFKSPWGEPSPPLLPSVLYEQMETFGNANMQS